MSHEPTRAPDRTDAVTRGRRFRAAALAAGGALAAVTALGAADRLRAAPSAEQDTKVLNLLLLVERVEAAFYKAALADAGLTGELEEYAPRCSRTSRSTSRTSRARSATRPTPSRTSTSPRSPRRRRVRARAAAQLEDVAVGAYNGQAANVTPGAFLAAARIVSVEARHAAWIRSIRDGDPAPDAVDVPYDEQRVRRELRELGVTS